MTRNPRLYLVDIVKSIKLIEEYTKGISFEEFTKTQMIKDAVARNLEIIGEAAARVPEDIQENYSKVPWYEMKGMRNILAHEYFRVDMEIVWKTARKDLRKVVPQIEDILASLD